MARHPNIERLTPEDRGAALDVLCASFRDYPVMRYALAHSGDEYDTHLRDLIGFFCDARYMRGWPVLGIRDDGRVVAAALVSEALVTPRPVDLQAAYHRLEQSIGTAALDRMNRYEELSSGAEPDTPYYYVGMVGVSPECQGRGYGRALLAHVAEMSKDDPLSHGVCLSTEDPRNVAYYESLGYRIIGEADVDALHAWCMPTPDGA